MITVLLHSIILNKLYNQKNINNDIDNIRIKINDLETLTNNMNTTINNLDARLLELEAVTPIIAK